MGNRGFIKDCCQGHCDARVKLVNFDTYQKKCNPNSLKALCEKLLVKNISPVNVHEVLVAARAIKSNILLHHARVLYLQEKIIVGS